MAFSTSSTGISIVILAIFFSNFSTLTLIVMFLLEPSVTLFLFIACYEAMKVCMKASITCIFVLKDELMIDYSMCRTKNLLLNNNAQTGCNTKACKIAL